MAQFNGSAASVVDVEVVTVTPLVDASPELPVVESELGPGGRRGGDVPPCVCAVRDRSSMGNFMGSSSSPSPPPSSPSSSSVTFPSRLGMLMLPPAPLLLPPSPRRASASLTMTGFPLSFVLFLLTLMVEVAPR